MIEIYTITDHEIIEVVYILIMLPFKWNLFGRTFGWFYLFLWVLRDFNKCWRLMKCVGYFTQRSWLSFSQKKEQLVFTRAVNKKYTVKPLKYGHQRDRTKCPLYRGVRIIEVGNVWFLAFRRPNELSIIERCPYYRDVCKERLDCHHKIWM